MSTLKGELHRSDWTPRALGGWCQGEIFEDKLIGSALKQPLVREEIGDTSDTSAK